MLLAQDQITKKEIKEEWIGVPLRISFIGGGTDMPEYFRRYGGKTISCTINHYAYIANHNKYEDITNYDDLLLATKTWAKAYGVEIPNIITVSSDAPPGSGLGTSSAIAVGLIKLLRPYLHPYLIAREAIILEREIAQISGGWQDQFIAAIPGLNIFEYNTDGTIRVIPFTPYNYFSFEELASHILLVDTGIIRRQANIMNTQLSKTKTGELDKQLNNIKKLVSDFETALIHKNWTECGYILDKSWEYKKELSNGISIPHVDDILDTAKRNRTYLGGKLLGAGGGGYVLIFCSDRNLMKYYLTSKGFRCYTPSIVTGYLNNDTGQS